MNYIKLTKTFLISCLFFCFSLSNKAQDVINKSVHEKEGLSDIKFGIRSSYNQSFLSGFANGVFISRKNLRATMLINISKFSSAFEESYSISGGKAQLDYSIFRNKRFNPYVGINYQHSRYADGIGSISSQNYYESEFHQCYNVFANAFNSLGGLEVKTIDGMSIILELGIGFSIDKYVLNKSSIDHHCNQELDIELSYRSFAGIGMLINLTELYGKFQKKKEN